MRPRLYVAFRYRTSHLCLYDLALLTSCFVVCGSRTGYRVTLDRNVRLRVAGSEGKAA